MNTSDQRIRFTCPHCQTGIRAAYRKAGTTAACPKCRHPIQVPFPTGSAADVSSISALPIDHQALASNQTTGGSTAKPPIDREFLKRNQANRGTLLPAVQSADGPVQIEAGQWHEVPQRASDEGAPGEVWITDVNAILVEPLVHSDERAPGEVWTADANAILVEPLVHPREKIHCVCPQCQAVIKASAQRAGTMIKCPQCKSSFEVPVPTADLLQPSIQPESPVHKPLWLVGILALVTLLAVVGVFFVAVVGVVWKLGHTAAPPPQILHVAPEPRKEPTVVLTESAAIEQIKKALNAWARADAPRTLASRHPDLDFVDTYFSDGVSLLRFDVERSQMYSHSSYCEVWTRLVMRRVDGGECRFARVYDVKSPDENGIWRIQVSSASPPGPGVAEAAPPRATIPPDPFDNPGFNPIPGFQPPAPPRGMDLPDRVCSSCRGTGFTDSRCRNCGGSGKDFGGLCRTCNGSGFQKCGSCFGKGKGGGGFTP